MSDPRFKNGTRSEWHKNKTPLFDSPTAYGWEHAGVNDDGFRIYRLGPSTDSGQVAQMRLTMSRDGLTDDWLVFVNGEAVASFTGNLAWITKQVRQMLCDEIPFDGRPCLQEANAMTEAGL